MIEEMLLRVSDLRVQAEPELPKMGDRQGLSAIAALGDRRFNVCGYPDVPIGRHVLVRQIGDAHLLHVWRLM